MTINHYTENKATQILATASRKIDITPYELSQVHLEIGKYMSFKILDEFDLEDYEINHPQGTKIGKRISDEKNIVILTFMRAGVFYGEGLRYIFQDAPFYYISPKRDFGILESELEKLPDFTNKIIILVDSVINTGATMFKVINQLKSYNPKKIIVTCTVMPDTTVDIIERDFKDIIFYITRISSNKYVGKGKTDTGNRLFGTFDK